jgi:predicted RNase H-like HicB family nuclease
MPRARDSVNLKSFARQSCWEPLKQVGAIITGMGKGRQRTKVRQFTVLIEQDEDGYYVASVPALHSCYTQARTLEELAPRIREVIALCLAEQKAPRMKFVGVQQVEVCA